MVQRPREFQIFAKPAGALCNLECQYCYYLAERTALSGEPVFRMADDLLEEYIVQQIAITPGDEVLFSWHGGEPTISGSTTSAGLWTSSAHTVPPANTSSTASRPTACC